MSLEKELAAACGVPVDVYLTENARGAVVICPGGCYQFRSEREGAPVARRFNGIGLHAFVLQYTCRPELPDEPEPSEETGPQLSAQAELEPLNASEPLDASEPADEPESQDEPKDDRPPLGNTPLNELAKAVAAVRAHAEALSIPKDRIAVCGFSAGGHLAASLGILWMDKTRFPEGTDLAAHRPDAMILSYPVITSGIYAHRTSMEQLAGPEWTRQEAYSLETLVTAQAVPAFLWNTVDDEEVPYQNSMFLVNALVRKGVPCEYHLYPHGVHGLSLATPEVDEPEEGRLADPHVAGWFDQMTEWLAFIWSESCV